MSRDIQAVLEKLAGNDGLAAVEMKWLREQYEAEWQKLSLGRSAQIADWLDANGIAHQPAPLPRRETDYVMLYERQSPIGIYIAAARLEGPFARSPVGAAMMLGHLARTVSPNAAPDESQDETEA
ncbi:hypothetical protein [Streptomyces sp. SPB074]|uniref:hypothetical protein n=1 Tax=Streptomyces sp. (strain SPB074) TaxID=465543 RepID=UPI0002F1E6F2|nr:hypothetical protein [Streptomyces sp. SPB074]